MRPQNVVARPDRAISEDKLYGEMAQSGRAMTVRKAPAIKLRDATLTATGWPARPEPDALS